MTDTFRACTLPWRIWPWGLRLTHTDTDMLPECSVEFGVKALWQNSLLEELWVRVDFELAAFASMRPHRDDEDLLNALGYDIIPRRRTFNLDVHQHEEAEWMRTGACPNPDFYFSTNSRWLETERRSWAHRLRANPRPDDAVHFLLDGRDGYIEILASGFSWRAWHPGHPLLSAVSGEPVMSGVWVNGDALI